MKSYFKLNWWVICLFLFIVGGHYPISWEYAGKYFKQVKTIEGEVVISHMTEIACYLGFHADWDKYLTAVILAEDMPKFPPRPDIYYLYEKVQVKKLNP